MPNNMHTLNASGIVARQGLLEDILCLSPADERHDF